jgi:hypothetical protein
MTRVLEIKASQLSAESLGLRVKAQSESGFLSKLIAKQMEGLKIISETKQSKLPQEAFKTVAFYKRLDSELRREIVLVKNNLQNLSKAIRATDIKKERIDERQKEIKVLKKSKDEDEKLEEIQALSPIVLRKHSEGGLKLEPKAQVEERIHPPLNITLTVTRGDGVQAQVSIKPTEISVHTSFSSDKDEQELKDRLKRAAKGGVVRLNEYLC